MSEQPDRNLWIGGRYVAPAAGNTFATLHPGSGEVICHVAEAGPEDVDRAVASAAEGQRLWGAMSGTERGRVLQRAALLLRENRDELARLEALDGGKPIAETPEADVDSGADCLEYFAGQASSMQGEYQAVDGGFFYTRREALGVCAGIGAWNYPLQIACWKSAPALAAGNAMVFKPAELTPLSALRLAELFTEAGLPDGVFNVVQGFADTGRALVRHPGVAKVSLTGEVGTGKAVMRDASESLKAVTMELGGKSPLIVFDDADLDNAVSGALLANFYTQGEICTNGTRVYVHESVREDFLERLAERTRALRIGDPMDPRTDVGAMISEGHMNHVLGYIERGREAGARLVTGGGRETVPGFEGGWYVQPTIFADCSDDMANVREEIFGPVMSVLSFGGESEVIERANDTVYGLAGGVFTRDLTRGHRVAAALDAGVVWVNHYNLTPIEMPFGGVKQSGIGRENSRHALEHYTRLKSVYVAMEDVEAPY